MFSDCLLHKISTKFLKLDVLFQLDYFIGGYNTMKDWDSLYSVTKFLNLAEDYLPVFGMEVWKGGRLTSRKSWQSWWQSHYGEEIISKICGNSQQQIGYRYFPLNFLEATQLYLYLGVTRIWKVWVYDLEIILFRRIAYLAMRPTGSLILRATSDSKGQSQKLQLDTLF